MLRITIDRDIEKGEYIITAIERNYYRRFVLHTDYTSVEQLSHLLADVLVHWGDWVEDFVIQAIEEGKG